MARTADLSDIKNRALWRADFPLTTTRIDTTAGGELETMIQEAAADLYEQIAQFFGEDYFFKEDGITVLAGVKYAALPADHYKTIHVWWTPPGETRFRMLDVFPPDEEYDREDSPQWNSSSIPRYRERGSKIYFEPTPDRDYRPIIQYVPVMDVVDSSGDPFPGVHGWDEWIVIKVAIACQQKDQMDTAPLERELTRQFERIKTNAPKRNIHRKQHVRRTRVPRWRGRLAGGTR